MESSKLVYSILFQGTISLVLSMIIFEVSKRIVIYKCNLKRKIFPIKTTRDRNNIIAISTILFFVIFRVSSIYSYEYKYIIFLLIFLGYSILVGTIDWWIRIIPNEVVLSLSFIGIIYQYLFNGINGLWSSISISFIIGIAFGLIMCIFKIIGKTNNAIGAGDLKLLLAVGIVCGYNNIIIAILAMSLSMASFCIIGLSTKRLNMKSYFPMGGFIMAGMIISFIAQSFNVF